MKPAKIEKTHGAIIIASLGTMSVGCNIKNLDNIILTCPSKSKIQIFQSIGRSLRITEGKISATLYDIADDLSVGMKRNFTLKHWLSRVGYYNSEKFPYEVLNVDLSNYSSSSVSSSIL